MLDLVFHALLIFLSKGLLYVVCLFIFYNDETGGAVTPSNLLARTTWNTLCLSALAFCTALFGLSPEDLYMFYRRSQTVGIGTF